MCSLSECTSDCNSTYEESFAFELLACLLSHLILVGACPDSRVCVHSIEEMHVLSTQIALQITAQKGLHLCVFENLSQRDFRLRFGQVIRLKMRKEKEQRKGENTTKTVKSA